MPNEKLVSYIQRQLRKGISFDKIKSKLLKAGHKLDNVEEAFSYINKKNNFGKIFIITSVLVLLAVLILYYTITSSPQKGVGEEVTEQETTTTTMPPPEQLPASEQSIYGDFPNTFDRRIIYAIGIKRPIACQVIGDEAIRQRCEELAQEAADE